jgi:hypothetical protein
MKKQPFNQVLVRRAFIIMLAASSLTWGSTDGLSADDSTKPEATNQPAFFESVVGYLENQVKLQYTTANLTQSQQPATFQYVNNRDGAADSYAIDAALSVGLIPPSAVHTYDWLYIGPTLEYHKNNQTSKPQDNVQAGLTSYQLFGKTAAKYLFVQETLKYTRDRINVGDSFFPQIDLSGLNSDWAMSSILGPKQLKFMWIPDLGLQYQSGSDIAQSGKSGSEWRVKASIEGDVYPFAMSLHNRLQLSAAYTYWRAFSESGEYESMKSDYRNFRAGAAYFLDDNNHFAVGVDYNNGENVETGSPNQENITVALKIKF